MSSDESYKVMKLPKKWKGVMAGDVSPVAMFFIKNIFKYSFVSKFYIRHTLSEIMNESKKIWMQKYCWNVEFELVLLHNAEIIVIDKRKPQRIKPRVKGSEVRSCWVVSGGNRCKWQKILLQSNRWMSSSPDGRWSC